MNMDVSAALDVAIRAHAGQVDKAGWPYIMHVVRVMAGVPPDNEEAQIVAALHGVVEDADWTVEELRVWFARHICDAVEALTRREDEDYAAFNHRISLDDIACVVRRSKLSALVADNYALSFEHATDPINDVMTA